MTDSLLFNSGSQVITGSLTATSFTGSLQGTSTSSSFAVTASYARTSSICNGVSQLAVSIYSIATNSSLTLTPAFLGSAITGYGTVLVDAGNQITYNPSTNRLDLVDLGATSITGSLQGTATTSSYALTAQTLLGSVTSASYAVTSSLSQETIGAGLYGGEIQIRNGSNGRNTYDAAFSWNLFTGGLNVGDPNSTGGNGAYYLAVGVNSLANGNYSVAFGSSSLSSGLGSFTHGGAVTAAGDYSHAEGFGPIAVGVGSHAEGQFTISSGSYQHVEGRFNTHGDNTSLLIVGNGTSNVARKDAFKVRMSGSIVLPTTQSAAPSWTGTDGEMVFATITGNHFFYVWMAGAWRSGSLS